MNLNNETEIKILKELEESCSDKVMNLNNETTLSTIYFGDRGISCSDKVMNLNNETYPPQKGHFSFTIVAVIK